jgi:MFS family permease
MKIALLKQKDFFLLMQGKAVSLLGSNIQSFALSLYVLKTFNSATLFASILILASLPRLLLGPIAGVFVDRLDRKKIIVYSDLINGLFILAMAGLFFIQGYFSIYQIYGMVIFTSMVSILFDPAVMTVIPSIVPKDDLYDANALNSLIMQSIALGAPIISGILMTLIGISGVMLLNGVSFVFSALSELFISIPKIEKKEKKLSFGTFKEDFNEGISFIFNHEFMLTVMIISIVFNFSINPIFSIGLPHILKKVLEVSDFQYGLFNSIILGVTLLAPILGTVVAKKIDIKEQLLYSVGIQPIFILGFLVVLKFPFTFSLFYLSSGFLMLILIGILVDVSMSILNLTIGTYYQRTIPRELIGRVMTVYSTIAMTSIPIGQGLFGICLDHFGVLFPYIVSLILLSGTSLLTYKLVRKSSVVELPAEEA